MLQSNLKFRRKIVYRMPTESPMGLQKDNDKRTIVSHFGVPLTVCWLVISRFLVTHNLAAKDSPKRRNRRIASCQRKEQNVEFKCWYSFPQFSMLATCLLCVTKVETRKFLVFLNLLTRSNLIP